MSIKHGFLGPNFCITSACSSSAHSIGEAFLKIRYGELDAVVAGGSEAPISRLGVGGFASMKALSKRNDEPERASRPFDRDRDGFVIGEGAVTLILEEESLARKRGATIYGEIVGYGANADAFHLTAPSSDGKGAGRCMELALKQAQVSVDQVSYINMHGTSTPLGDVAETNAIKRVFGDSSHQVVCSSTKSMTGHLLGAAGSIEAMFTLFSLKNSKITPTINLENQDEECDLDYCANEARELDVKFALSNSFGFGGTNASLLFQRYD